MSILKLTGAAFIVAGLVPQQTGSNPTIIEITGRVIQPSVKRFGMNLGPVNSYDASQMMKNLLFRNPGFEGEIYQSIVRCATSSENTCTEENASSAWPAGFWNHASYEFLWGAAKGRRGEILNSTAATKVRGVTLTLGDEGDIPLPGDYAILRMSVPDQGETGWWPNICCGGSIRTERRDTAAGAGGSQALRLSSLAGGRAAIDSFFDSTPGRSFVQLNGRYFLRFTAKGAGGRNLLDISVRRLTIPSPSIYLSKSVNVSAQWTRYSFPIDVRESGNSPGTVQVEFAAAHSDVLLDDVSLQKESDSNPTPFRDEVVSVLRQLHPGLLRYWGGQLGDSLDNQIAPPSSRRRAGYSLWKAEQDQIQYGLQDFLQLCSVIGADPYYVAPITFSPGEMGNLIQFLAGSPETPYGKKRAALGRTAPWTEVFGKIHIEFGNEAWNPIFKGGNIEDPVAFGNRAGEIFHAARAAMEFRPDKFDLVLDGQAVNLPRNKKILSACRENDSFSVAPYQMDKVDSYSTDHELFGPLLAEPQAITSAGGYMARTASLLNAGSKPIQLSAYEVNINTVNGSLTQDALDSLAPSLGSGLAVIENMLLMLRDLGVRDQMLWVLSQDSFKRNDGKVAKLYGSVVDMVSGRKRPVFLAMQLANEAVMGDLVETRQHGENPTWDESGANGITIKGAHEIESFGFSSGDDRSLILLNLKLDGPLVVEFTGAGAPRGSVHLRRLEAPSISSNNEAANAVVIVRRDLQWSESTNDFDLPPHSMTVLTWKGKRRNGTGTT